VVALVTLKMSKCTACGSILETFEYQARSADEATRVKTTCPSCPVDASKIKLTHRPVQYARGLSGPVRLPRRFSTQQTLSTTRKLWRVKVDCTSSVAQVNAETRHITCPVFANKSRSVSNISEITSQVRYQITGTTEGQCESLLHTLVLGFGAVLEAVQLYEGTDVQLSSTRICEGRYGVIESDYTSITYLYNDSVSNKNTIIVQSDVALDVTSAAAVVARLYGTTCIPKSLQTYMERRFVSEYANLAPRAWDVSAPPTTGYKFTSKPDGERMWLVLHGAFWYACEAQKDRKILKWWYSPQNSVLMQGSIICDTEYVAGYGFIFIDALTDATGKPVPVVRDLEYSLTVASEILDLTAGCPLIVRKYFDNNDDAQTYSDKQPYATDGTLGIRDGSTETIKIKPVKGVDLLLSPGGALLTGDGDTVASISDYPQSYVGKVVEARFTAKANSTHIRVLDIFPRTNKSTANSTEAVMNILRSCVQVNSTTDKERTIALKWCNMLCTNIITRALAIDDTKHIVLDVGTGSGQSLDRLRRNDSVSFIYLEPDEVRAMAISRRSRARLLRDASELGPMIMSLKTRRTMQVVVNCELGDLINNTQLCKVLMPEVKCVMATFSAQFVVTELRQLRDVYKAKVFGCMYTYDDAVDDVLVDACGALMKIVEGDTALIRWGTEKEYTEPVTYEDDYYGLGNVVLGSDVLQLPIGVDSKAPSEVCKHIRVII
jgi:hypothetical protein